MAVSRDHPNLAAEVVGARAALGAQYSAEVSPGSSQLIADSALGANMDGFLEDMVAADHLDIVGILPWRCASRLMEITAKRIKQGQGVVSADRVRYYTSERDRITVYRHSDLLGSLVQRWIGGITGVRNWLLPRGLQPHRSENLLYEFPDVYLDCLVHIRNDQQSKVIAFTQLPYSGALTAASNVVDAPLIVTELPRTQADEVTAHISTLAPRARPLVSRELICQIPDMSIRRTEGSEFNPVILRLNRYDAERPPLSVIPVTVVAIVAPTPHGYGILLKNRTKWNSREDFSTLSLVSERILEEDVAEAMTPPLSFDDARALDELWLRMNRPRPFTDTRGSFSPRRTTRALHELWARHRR